MSSSEKRSSVPDSIAPSAPALTARPAEPSERERLLLSTAHRELTHGAAILRSLAGRLGSVRRALRELEPRACIVAVGEQPYSEVRIVAEDLGDCIAILREAWQGIDPAKRPTAREMIAGFVANEREHAEREGYRAAEKALAAFDAGDSEAALAGAAEFARLLELADSMNAGAVVQG